MMPDQVAAVSFLLRRGLCRNCKSPLPMRGPVVEIATALVFGFLWSRFGATWASLSMCLMTAVLLLMTVIDLEHRLILNVVVLPFTLVAILLSPLVLDPVTPQKAFLTAILGAVVGYLFVFGIYILGKVFVMLMARARGHRIDEVAFGMGDVKLAGLIGALVGFPSVIYALVYAILLGGVAAFGVLLFQVLVRRRYSAFMAIPYGPFIAIAAWLVMVFGAGFGRVG
jgi:leader peptidase (prepilin peptidase) / N-methyltransferase